MKRIKKIFIIVLITALVCTFTVFRNDVKTEKIGKWKVSFQEATGATSTIYDLDKITKASLCNYFIDTTITKNATYTTKTFILTEYPYHSIQVRVTAAGGTPTTITLSRQCAQFDSATYWTVASVDSFGEMVVPAATDTMVIWGNSDLCIPVTRYLRFVITETNINNAVVKIFINRWRSE